MEKINIKEFKKIFDKYLNFKKSEIYDENYKFEFFQNNQIDFSKVNDFEGTFREIRKQAINLFPRKVRDNLFIHLGREHKEELKELFSFLYDETIDINERVNIFIKKIFNFIKNDEGWKNKDLGKIGFSDVSLFLALYDYKKYLFINPIKPFNNFIEKFNLDKNLYKKSKNGERYKNWLELSKKLILELEKIYNKKFNLLDIQDFIYCSFGGYNENIKENKLENSKNYWIYAPGENAKFWDEFYDKGIMGIGWEEMEDLRKYKNKDELAGVYEKYFGKKGKNDLKALEDFSKNMKIGDIVIAKKGIKNYIGYGIVSGDYEFDEKRENYNHIRKIKWVKKGIWEETNGSGKIVLKTLTNITKYKDYVKNLINLLGINAQNIMQTENTQKLLENSKELLDSKKQIILFGPPGTGKTYNVKNIIKNHSGEDYENLKKSGRVEFLTFHQSFSYEEFIEGIKAETDNGQIFYEIKDGIFKEICERAKQNYENSKNTESINVDYLINDFSNFVEEKEKFEIRKGTYVKVNKNSNGDFKTFKTYGNVDNQSLTKEIIKRDFQDFLNGKIKTPDDIKPSRESKSERHGNAIYYFFLLKELKKFYELNSNKYRTQKQNLQNYYLIIDEINRGNISKIFGELITLLEADKRLEEENETIIKLPYSKQDFGVPSNLYIIATMNTSDKSIVNLDTALRRRFGFLEVLPDYELLEEKNIDGINLDKLIEKINFRIEYLLDKDHLIGHSYFLKVKNLGDLKRVFYNEIIPLLEEYFYGEEEKIKAVLGGKFFEKQEKIQENLFEDNEFFEEEIEKIKILDIKNFLDALKNIVKINEN